MSSSMKSTSDTSYPRDYKAVRLRHSLINDLSFFVPCVKGGHCPYWQAALERTLIQCAPPVGA